MNDELVKCEIKNLKDTISELKTKVEEMSDMKATLLLLTQTVSDLKDVVADLQSVNKNKNIKWANIGYALIEKTIWLLFGAGILSLILKNNGIL